MFNILKFSTEETTGQTEVRVCFQSKINSPIIDDGGTFSSRLQARAWLHNCQKDWFLTRVENYIAHKKIIIDNAPRGHKTHITKLNAIAELLRYIEYVAKTKSLYEATKWFINQYSNFQAVLPAQSNPSYGGAIAEIELLYKFAKEYYEKSQNNQAA